MMRAGKLAAETAEPDGDEAAAAQRPADRQRRRAHDVGKTRKSKPRLRVDTTNPDLTVARVRDLLQEAGELFDRGVPVRIAYDEAQKGHVAHMMTPDGLVRLIHSISRPYVTKTCKKSSTFEVDVAFPRNLAVMYLDWRGEWRLRPLNGIASAPLLSGDGTIGGTKGYDPTSGMWCEQVPDLDGLVPERPTREDAETALKVLREPFKTFCFADAETVEDPHTGLPIVDLSKPPGADESAFLNGLLTAVCRPSLHLSPGIVVRAAQVSGAGAGKGLLIRCISLIAYGREPRAVTAGSTRDELEKRIAAELIEGGPILFLDNLNNLTLRSDLLASAITERPARIRVLGESRMVTLNPSAFVALTGNGLTISEDLARRFVYVELDPRTEDPEMRPFSGDIRDEITKRRIELLAAALTIWRWGRQSNVLVQGRSLGNFGQWAQWVRDPLLALGCRDPVERLTEMKERDAWRQETVEILRAWSEKHGDSPVTASGLHDDVKHLLDPQGRGRQFIASRLEKMTGTRAAGFVLTRQDPAGNWGTRTYALIASGTETHRGHRGQPSNVDPMPPMDPMHLRPGEEITEVEREDLSSKRRRIPL